MNLTSFANETQLIGQKDFLTLTTEQDLLQITIFTLDKLIEKDKKADKSVEKTVQQDQSMANIKPSSTISLSSDNTEIQNVAFSTQDIGGNAKHYNNIEKIASSLLKLKNERDKLKIVQTKLEAKQEVEEKLKTVQLNKETLSSLIAKRSLVKQFTMQMQIAKDQESSSEVQKKEVTDIATTEHINSAQNSKNSDDTDKEDLERQILEIKNNIEKFYNDNLTEQKLKELKTNAINLVKQNLRDIADDIEMRIKTSILGIIRFVSICIFVASVLSFLISGAVLDFNHNDDAFSSTLGCAGATLPVLLISHFYLKSLPQAQSSVSPEPENSATNLLNNADSIKSKIKEGVDKIEEKVVNICNEVQYKIVQDVGQISKDSNGVSNLIKNNNENPLSK